MSKIEELKPFSGRSLAPWEKADVLLAKINEIVAKVNELYEPKVEEVKAEAKSKAKSKAKPKAVKKEVEDANKN